MGHLHVLSQENLSLLEFQLQVKIVIKMHYIYITYVIVILNSGCLTNIHVYQDQYWKKLKWILKKFYPKGLLYNFLSADSIFKKK